MSFFSPIVSIGKGIVSLLGPLLVRHITVSGDGYVTAFYDLSLQSAAPQRVHEAGAVTMSFIAPYIILSKSEVSL
jgi:hypothetical protein